MSPIIVGFLTFVFVCLANAAENVIVPAGCKLNTLNGYINGLSGGVYYYPYVSYGTQNMDLLYESSYQQGGYAANPNIVRANDDHNITQVATVATGVTITNFAFDLPTANVYDVWKTGNIYKDGVAVSFPATNYVFSVSGYLIPNITGNYNIEIDSADDFLIMSIGAGISSFDCCSSSSEPVSVNNQTAQYIQKLNDPAQSNIFYMVAGYAYPINVFYGNLGGKSLYTIKYTDPNGLTSSDFTGFGFSSFDVVDDSVCTEIYITETTLPWTGTTTSVTSSTGAVTAVSTVTSMDGIPEHVVTNVIESIIVTEYTPVPHVTSTFYTAYTGNEISTYSTENTLINSTVVSVIYDVDTPYSTYASRTTSFYTETTSSFSTLVTTITPSTGAPYVSSIVYVDVPDGETTLTSFTPGSYSYNTTYSTSLTTVIGDNGTPTGSTIYYVYTPYSTYASTTTSFYTETTTSFLTLVTTITPSTGSPYVSSIVHVDVPDVNEVSTTYTKGSVSTITTYSTSYYTLTGNNSQLTFGTIYFVETPSKDFYTTIPWTGAYTTTLSSDYSFTGSDGITTTLTYFTVETPEVHTISTTTTYWTGACTSYLSIISSFTGTDDKATVETIITVKIPTSSQGWNSTTSLTSTTPLPSTTILNSTMPLPSTTILNLTTSLASTTPLESTKSITAKTLSTSTTPSPSTTSETSTSPTSASLPESTKYFTETESYTSTIVSSNCTSEALSPTLQSVTSTKEITNLDFSSLLSSNLPSQSLTETSSINTFQHQTSTLAKSSEVTLYTQSSKTLSSTPLFLTSSLSSNLEISIQSQTNANSGTFNKINSFVAGLMILINFI